MGQTLQMDPAFVVDGDNIGQNVVVEHPLQISGLKLEVKQEAEQVINCQFDVPVIKSELTGLLQQDMKPLIQQNLKPAVSQVTSGGTAQASQLNGDQTAALKTLLQLNREAHAKIMQEVVSCLSVCQVSSPK